MPLASGLGSSGASAAAGAVAANELLGRPLSPVDLVACAMEGEKAACGSAHADNVAPSVLGGFVLVRSYDPLDLVRLPVPDGVFVAVVHPHCRVSTKEARARLAGHVFPLPAIVANSGNLGALVAALYQGDAALLGRSVQDALVEPVRAEMIPGFAAVKAAAGDAGALACSISGSGPSMFAFADSADVAAQRGAGDARGVQGRGRAHQRRLGRPDQPRRRARGGVTMRLIEHDRPRAGRQLPRGPAAGHRARRRPLPADRSAVHLRGGPGRLARAAVRRAGRPADGAAARRRVPGRRCSRGWWATP